MELHWSGATRYHDWMNDDKATPAAMITQLAEAGLLGKLEWINTGMHGKKETQIPAGNTLLDYLPFKPKRNDLYILAGGGTKPFNWKLTLGLFPFNEQTQMVQGYNIINLWVEKNELLNPEGSELLFNTFKKIHRAGNTEFAFIHPAEHWATLTDTFYGPYAIPVTFNPMFTGVYWSTFLGPGQLELFDRNKIKNIKEPGIYFENEDELYIRMTENIAAVINKPEEEKMIALTEQFRQAMK